MNEHGHKPELRDARTIRAYLDELALTKSPVQITLSHADPAPFETTLDHLSATTLSVTTTPPLEIGQTVHLSFLLDNRWFTTFMKVEATGVFSLPTCVSPGERRAHPRASFNRNETDEVFAVERIAGTIPGGRTVLGKVQDLGMEGIRVVLDEVATLSGPDRPLRRGDAFTFISISNLPHTPTICCSGTVAHVTPGPPETLTAGIHLAGIGPGDQRNLERILTRRVPATFGQAFPGRKLKTDVADRPGAPTPTKVKAKAPEVVERQPEPAPPEPPEPPKIDRKQLTPVMRLRKLGRKILFLSSDPQTPALAEAMRQDGFKHTFLAGTPAEAEALARQHRFDLVLVDLKVGGFWGQGLVAALRGRGLLLAAPVILVAEFRNELARDAAQALAAVHIHERRQGYDELAPILNGTMLVEHTAGQP